MNTQIRTLSNAVARADQSCGELILKPETAGEYAHNAEIVSGLREQVASITAMIKAMSTGVDIAPQVLPDPPSEIWVSADLTPTPHDQ